MDSQNNAAASGDFWTPSLVYCTCNRQVQAIIGCILMGKKIYITITGTVHYLGDAFLKEGTRVTLIKDRFILETEGY